MNTDIAIQIIELALSLVKDQSATSVASVLAQIVGKAAKAYKDQTGQPVDPSLIPAEDPV